jgi:hypothetical protein
VKNILILFLGDLKFDSRCSKIIRTLSKNGHKITVIIALDEKIKNQKYQIPDPGVKIIPVFLKRKNNKQPFLQYYIKSLKIALKQKADIIFSSELYSLPVAFLTKKKINQKFIMIPENCILR